MPLCQPAVGCPASVTRFSPGSLNDQSLESASQRATSALSPSTPWIALLELQAQDVGSPQLEPWEEGTNPKLLGVG